MRAFKTSFLLLTVFLLIAPSPAQAWWGWLDELSGPGRFWGAEFDLRMVCLMQQAPWPAVIAEASVASAQLASVAGEPNSLAAHKTAASKFNDIALSLPAAIGTPLRALQAADRMQTFLDTFNDLPEPTKQALERTISSVRASAVPRVSKFPGSVAWSSCTDRSASDDSPKIRHRDRHEVLSIVMNYREYWNSDYSHWGHANNDTYAGGEIIHLRIIEPKLSWPMSGGLDVLDGQAGMGLYSFSSKGLPGTRVGLIVEPIRFDLHFPSKLADAQRNFFARLPLALSFRTGVVLFPAGFAPDAFNAKDTAARRIPGGEALFEYGIVVNVGRLFQ